MAGELMLRVKFTGTDRLSRMLDSISGSTKRAARNLQDTNIALKAQKTELKNVQRQIAAGSGNLTKLIDQERALEKSVAGSTRQLERQKKFVNISARTSRAKTLAGEYIASGQAGLLTTTVAAAPLIAIAKETARFEALQNRMRVLGLGDGAVKDLTAFANAMNVAGSSVNDNMRYLLEAQGVFRESGENNLTAQLSGAKLMAPLLAKLHVVAQTTGKELAEDQERYFLRFIEQAGGLTNSKRAASLADGLFRALQSSGGNIQASDYQGFLAHAGIAGSHLSTRSMFADFEPLIGELHEGAGVGLATAFKQATGIRVNSRAASEFMRLGLWDKGSVTLNKLGGVKSTKGNPLQSRAADLLAHDPVEFYRQIVLPAYGRAGINTSEGRAFENAKLFGGTGGNLFNLVDKQLATILRSRGAYGKSQSLDRAYAQTNASFFGSEGKLTAAMKNFMVAAGTKGGLLDNITALMGQATAALTAFTAAGNAHPTAFRWLGTIVTDLLLLRGAVAVTKIAFGGILGPLARLWGIWSKIRVAGSIAEAFPMLARGAALLVGVLEAPVVLIGALVAGVAFLAYEVYQHWGAFKKSFVDAWVWIKGMAAKFRACGSNLVSGLLGGITSGLAALRDGIFGLGAKVVGWFKQKLGIHSPSRVFAQLGGFMTAGLEQGLDRGAARPIARVRSLAGQLAAAALISTPALAHADAVRGAISRGQPASRAAPARASLGKVDIHIHQLPGQDSHALAGEIARLLEQLQRHEHALGRAAYDDEA